MIISDWENEEYYKRLEADNITPEEWAWEFLRRNRQYQEDWERYKGLPEENRSWYKTGSTQTLSKHEQIRSKWKLHELVDPVEPYNSKVVKFTKALKPAYQIVEHDYLYDALQTDNEQNPETDEISPTYIHSSQIVVVIDPKANLSDIKNEISSIVKEHMAQEDIEKGQRKNFTSKRAAALRALDMEAHDPNIERIKIAQTCALQYEKKDTQAGQTAGSKFLKRARATTKSYYDFVRP